MGYRAYFNRGWRAIFIVLAPDYTRSNSSSVIVQMSNSESDMAFVEMVLHEEKRIGQSLPLDSLIILSRLRQERRLTIIELTHSTQKSEQETRIILGKLVESGLVEAQGTGKGRTYILSAKLYQKTGQKAGYVRQAGFDPIQQEQMILSYIKEHKTIKRAEAADLCRIGPHQATRLLKKLSKEGRIILKGSRRGAIYERNT